ncbi:hypothetical protein SSX86_005424 [Deinandra increscens subsp. villosa]|uniref:Protein kinase domain-containing protein n=1 Tax=Deinandra increscens subsp. villosa TaxID=3103831 RepID=A0AAP0DPZ6_9ASTR
MASNTADSVPAQSSPAGETVIVVMNGIKGKGSLDALEWAIKYIVGAKDTVVVLGVLPEIGKKSNPSCLPFHLGIGSSGGIYIKLEFSNNEITPSELQKEIERKKREYQKFLEPYYHHCKKREVKLDIRLAAGLESKNIAIEEAQRLDPRWIVLDGYFKKDKEYIHNHVDCHVALLKTKGMLTLRKSRIHQNQSASSNPLSWRTGYQKALTLGDIEEITNGFNNVVLKDHNRILYSGVFGESHVIVICFPADDQAFFLLKIASRVRHRNILNLIGYCCVGNSVFFLCDCPQGSLESCLLCDKAATNLSWENRWAIALEIGAAIQYLHEEFVDGSIANLSICSANVGVAGNSNSCGMVTPTFFRTTNVIIVFGESRGMDIDANEYLRVDIKDYGVLLLELISGQSRRLFEKDGQCLGDWALPLLEKNLLTPLLDQRLTEPRDSHVAHMARAALACLKTDPSHFLDISKVGLCWQLYVAINNCIITPLRGTWLKFGVLSY